MLLCARVELQRERSRVVVGHAGRPTAALALGSIRPQTRSMCFGLVGPTLFLLPTREIEDFLPATTAIRSCLSTSESATFAFVSQPSQLSGFSSTEVSYTASNAQEAATDKHCDP